MCCQKCRPSRLYLLVMFMKAMEMPMAVITFLVIGVIVIAVSIIFAFSAMDSSSKSIGEDVGIVNQSNAVSVLNAQASAMYCESACSRAQAAANYYNKTYFCSDKVSHLEFCSRACDQFYSTSKKPGYCELTFSDDQISQLKCIGTPPVPACSG